MDEDDDWGRLVAVLDAWTSASSSDVGRIEVALPQDGGGGQVVIVMTPDEWDDMVSVRWGSFDDAVRDVLRTLRRLGPAEHYAVYSQYRLRGSATPILPSRGA